MEPDLHDGDDILVQYADAISPGEVGVFVADGEGFVKEYQPDGLHSHNPRYKTIYTGEGADVRCCGRVTGAVAEGDIATGPLAEKVMAAFDGADE